MKAKIISLKGKHELILENKQIFSSNEGETKTNFIKRVQKEVDEEDLEGTGAPLEIQELTADTYVKSKIGIVKLKEALKNTKGLVKELIEEAISILSVEKPKAEKPKAEKAVKEKVVKEKVVKEKVVKATLDEILAIAEEAKANIGHYITFSPHKTAIKTKGIINGVWVDKRVPMALYRIFDGDGAKHNKVIGASNFEIGELAPDTKAEAKAEKAAQKLADKEVADKAKAEKAAQKLADKEAKAEKAAQKLADKEAKAEKAAQKLAADKAKAEKAAETSKTGKK